MISLVSSGAKIKWWKLVLMLDQFRQGCCTDNLSVQPEDLFSSFKQLDQGKLLSIGFVHGIILTGGMEGMCDTIMSHVTTGACMLHSRMKVSCLVQVILKHYCCALSVCKAWKKERHWNFPS